MIRRPPRSTLDRSSAASDVYKRQYQDGDEQISILYKNGVIKSISKVENTLITAELLAVSYTHLRAHETVLDLVCRLLLEKKKTHVNKNATYYAHYELHTSAHDH